MHQNRDLVHAYSKPQCVDAFNAIDWHVALAFIH